MTSIQAALGSRATKVAALTAPEVLALPALVPVWPSGAAAVGGISRTAAYGLARARTFPVEVVEIHHRYYCRRADLLRFLGLTTDAPGATTLPN